MQTITQDLRCVFYPSEWASDEGGSTLFEVPDRKRGLGRESRLLYKPKLNVPTGWFVLRGFQHRSKDWRRSRSRSKLIVADWRERPSKESIIVQQPSFPRLKTVEQAIASSRWILELHNDWDEQGAVAYTESTWKRACDFLLRQAGFARQSFGRELPAPRILPGPNGSLDLHWKLRGFELLVNIPGDLTQQATFYGDDRRNLSIRGDVNTAEEIPGLIVWLLH